MTRCASCEQAVAAGRWCNRCGARLEATAAARRWSWGERRAARGGPSTAGPRPAGRSLSGPVVRWLVAGALVTTVAVGATSVSSRAPADVGGELALPGADELQAAPDRAASAVDPRPAAASPPQITVMCSDLREFRFPIAGERPAVGDVVDVRGIGCLVTRVPVVGGPPGTVPTRR